MIFYIKEAIISLGLFILHMGKQNIRRDVFLIKVSTKA